MKKILITLALLCTTLVSAAQSPRDFVTGADLGWITEQEMKGTLPRNAQGQPTEGTRLMRQYGLRAVRHRVWVDPSRHANWCSKYDLLNKALRAKALGMDLMVDFHYSDWWADPGKQNIPAAWSGLPLPQILEKVKAHTIEVLQLLKDYGVKPRWVQVGNETTHGLLWSVRTDSTTGWPLPDERGNNVITEDIARAETHPDAYAAVIKAGCEAAKSVFPDALTIVHLDDGFDRDLYTWNFDLLTSRGVSFDLIGMSLYPYWAIEGKKRPDARSTIEDCMQNIRFLAKRYGRDCMIVETGMNARQPEEGYIQLQKVLHEARTQTDGHCRGVFYWEPICPPSQYALGAFTEDLRPTKIMDAFLEDAQQHP